MQHFLLSCPLKADSKIVHLICWEWLLSTSSFLQYLFLSILISYSKHAYIGFLAWLKLLLESGPPGPKRVPHGQPVKQTNKQTSHPKKRLVGKLGYDRKDRGEEG